MIGVESLNNRLFLWIFIVNTCVALIYFLYRGVFRKEYRKAALLAAFMFFTPLAGAVFLAGSEAVNIVLFRRRDGLLNEEELSFSKKRTRMIISDDIEKEVDRVPVEEALIISDTANRRQSFLEVLKRPDAEDYMQRIRGAMAQGDSEVVHYAASYITDTIARYKETEKRLREIYEKSKDADALLIYLRFCSNMLHKHVLSVPEQRIYLVYFDGYLEELYRKDKEKLSGDMLADIIGFWMEIGDGACAGKWAERAGEYMESDLPAVKAVLKYYFASGDEMRFRETVKQIRESPLILDGEALEWVRFYGRTGW